MAILARREKPLWKRGNPSANRTAPQFKISSASRLDFLVFKVNGGAPLIEKDLVDLDKADVIKLSQHLHFILSRPSTATIFLENARTSLEMVEARLAALSVSSSASEWSAPGSELGRQFLEAQLRSALQPDIETMIRDLGTTRDHDHSSAPPTEEQKIAELGPPDAPHQHEDDLKPPSSIEPEESRTPPRSSKRDRKLSDWERATLEKYFPPWFDLSGIELHPTCNFGTAWFRGEVGILAEHFAGKAFRTQSVKPTEEALEFLFHEVFHVFQRSLGRMIGIELFFNRPSVRKQYYEYPGRKDENGSSGEATSEVIKGEVLDLFLRVNYESQAEMFGDAAAKQEAAASGPGNLASILIYIRNLPPESTVDALIHPDLPDDARHREPVPDSMYLR